MPEGPTVRRFCSLVAPFVGQQVVKVGGRTKQIALQELMGQWIQDCQVHGKNLYVAFGCDATHKAPSTNRQQADDDFSTSPTTSPRHHCQQSANFSTSPTTSPRHHCQQSVDFSTSPTTSPRHHCQQSADFSTSPTTSPRHHCQQSADFSTSPTTSPRHHCQQSADLSTSPTTSPDDLRPWEDEDASPRCKWLRFHFGLFGSIRVNELARAKNGNKRGDWKDPTPRLILHFAAGGFLVFYNCRILRCSFPHVEPTCDILSLDFDKDKAFRALSAPRPVCVSLMDQRYFSGIGNIIKNEILYLAQVHPLSLGSLLPVDTLRTIIGHAITFTARWLQNKMQREPLHYHIYMQELCPQGHKVVKESIGPPHGLQRLTWHCPTCQERLQ